MYRAFLDGDAMAKWLPPHGFTGKVHHLDTRAGGTYRMSFANLCYLRWQESLAPLAQLVEANVPG